MGRFSPILAAVFFKLFSNFSVSINIPVICQHSLCPASKVNSLIKSNILFQLGQMANAIIGAIDLFCWRGVKVPPAPLLVELMNAM